MPTPTVLIVDDMMMMRKLVRKSLQELGFTKIIEADNGAVAWEKLKESEKNGEAIGLVLSDWNMPVMTGIELLQAVRADAKFNSLPFFLLTAESEASQVASAIKLKVTGYLVKPFSTAQLGERLSVAFPVNKPEDAA